MGIAEYGELDGLGMAELVRKGDVSALELVDEAIKRIEALNPKLNAVVYPMYEQARALATSKRSGTLGGVPFLLKDMTAQYAGTPTTHGSRFMAGVANSDYDSEIVKRFKRAGLVYQRIRSGNPVLGCQVGTHLGRIRCGQLMVERDDLGDIQIGLTAIRTADVVLSLTGAVVVDRNRQQHELNE